MAAGRRKVEIGGVALKVADVADSPYIPDVPALRGVPASNAPPRSQLRVLRWMAQKTSMGQDMLLIGPPGPLLRHTAMRFCQLCRREVEYVSITRDTNEADLKQRREIVNGEVVYVDQPPVRAALHGRVLILEGIEKAERNVLPLLNNLLENREMVLEDKRFLLAPRRASQLQAEGHGAVFTQRLVPVHPDFIVVAIGDPRRGNPLDPPLRSRFAAFSMELPPPSEDLDAILRLGSVPPAVAQRVCTAAGTLHQLAAQGVVSSTDSEGPGSLPLFPVGGAVGVARLLGYFPGMDPSVALRRAYPATFLGMNKHQSGAVDGVLRNASDSSRIEYTLLRAWRAGNAATVRFAAIKDGDHAGYIEHQCTAGRWALAGDMEEEDAKDEAAGLRNDAGDHVEAMDAMSVKELKTWLLEKGVQPTGCFEKSELLALAKEWLALASHGPVQPQGLLSRPIGGVTLTPTQAECLSAMITDTVAGMDLCLMGEKGAGKTRIVHSFASILGYKVCTVFCYKDMLSRDLLQRRTTEVDGSTCWHDSPLVKAAVSGDLAVLDGIHRLERGVLASSLGQLLTDREMSLPDGSRLVPPGRWSDLLSQHGEDALREQRVRSVHESFRCIACCEPPGSSGRTGKSWLDDEVACLFHFHEVKALPENERRMIAARSRADSRILDGLFAYGRQIEDAAVGDPDFEPLRLSLRILLRIAAHLRQRPTDIEGALSRAFSACLRFLPLKVQETVDEMLVMAMSKFGVSTSGLRPSPSPLAAGTIRERTEALLGNVATASRDTMAIGHVVSNGLLKIGDVICPVRSPVHPELVPDVAFVETPKHMKALRDLLLDWSLGHNILLIGTQGVGKNKLVDRLLGLLDCEREYVQLHRDTTVQSLTLAPSLEAGVIQWEDTPLLRAVKAGRCLVVDEADKAPLEVVCVLKALAEDGHLALLDGRTIVREDDAQLLASGADACGDRQSTSLVQIAKGFRMVVLANRPGLPFLGNDFYRVCGDVFSCHAVDSLDIESEVALLHQVGPTVPMEQIARISLLFAELRDLVDSGQLSYPFSTRELVKVVQHMQEFQEDPIESALADIFSFDMLDEERCKPILSILRRHRVAVDATAEALLRGHGRGQQGYRLNEIAIGA